MSSIKLFDTAIPFLVQLYQKKGVAPTAAMTAALNRKYVPLDGILGTFDVYSQEPMVVEFVENNKDEIEEAKTAVATWKKADEERLKSWEAREEELEDRDLSRSKIEYVDPWKAIKSISLCDIESAFGRELSDLCGESLTVRVSECSESASRGSGEVELRILVKGEWHVG